MFLFYVYKCSFQFHVKVHHLGKCKEIYSMTKYICGILCASSFVVKSVRHLVSQFRLCFVCGVRSLLNYLSAWIRVVDCHKKSLKTAFVCTFPISDVLMFCFVKNSTWYWHDQVRTYWTNHSTMWSFTKLFYLVRSWVQASFLTQCQSQLLCLADCIYSKPLLITTNGNGYYCI